MAHIKLKDLLNEFFVPFISSPKRRETPAERTKRLKLVKKNKELRDKFEKLKIHSYFFILYTFIYLYIISNQRSLVKNYFLGRLPQF